MHPHRGSHSVHSFSAGCFPSRLHFLSHRRPGTGSGKHGQQGTHGKAEEHDCSGGQGLSGKVPAGRSRRRRDGKKRQGSGQRSKAVPEDTVL